MENHKEKKRDKKMKLEINFGHNNSLIYYGRSEEWCKEAYNQLVEALKNCDETSTFEFKDEAIKIDKIIYVKIKDD